MRAIKIFLPFIGKSEIVVLNGLEYIYQLRERSEPNFGIINRAMFGW